MPEALRIPLAARLGVRPPGSLGARAFGAGVWSVAGMGLQYPLRLAGNLIMTRLLAPEDFGLMALVLTLHMGLGLLSDVGIQQSVMRHPRGGVPRYLRMAWSVQIVRGLVLAGFVLAIGAVLALAGPRLAGPETILADARLPWLIWASAAMVLLTGLQSASVLLAARQMRVRDLVVLETAAQVIALGVMIGLGLLWSNVWALLCGAVAGAAAKTALSHLAMPGPRMRWHWDRVQARDMWRFGKWLIGASLGGFLVTHGDQLVFSALMDKATFGVYAIAVLWVSAGGQVLARISATVFVPSFGEVLNTRPGDTGQVLRSAFRAYSLASVAVAGATLIGAVIVVAWLYDPRYALAIPMICVLAFRNLLLRYSVLRQFITALGDSRHAALTSVCGGVAAMGLLYAAYAAHGIEMALAAAALAAVPMFAGTLLQPELRRLVQWRRELGVMLAISVACVALAGWLGQLEAVAAR